MKLPIILLITTLLLTGQVFAIPPPEAVKEANAQAPEIIIGKILEIIDAPPEWPKGKTFRGRVRYALFKLQVFHIIKTSSEIKEKDVIKVFFIYHPPNPTIEEMYVGPAAVRVKEGMLVLLYAKPSKFGEDILQPIISGHSVITLCEETNPASPQ